MADKDWYLVLKLAPDAPTAAIAQAVERLSRQAAAMANTAPERSQQLRETVRAMKRDLLSGDDSRARYDAQQAQGSGQGPSALAPQQPAAPVISAVQLQPSAPPVSGGPHVKKRPSRFMQFLQSGWTCPSCGEGALPGDKFCPRCGTDIPSPTVDELVGRTPRQPACDSCGTPSTSGNRFCTSCGKSLG